LFESIRFFSEVPLTDFLFGLQWSPQTSIRADQAASSGAFGAVPIFLGTLLITFIAMCVATPVGLFSAIYLSEYTPSQYRPYIKATLEILAGIPTVVYGYFAVTAFSPFLRDIGEIFGLSLPAESALSAGIVMGIMIIPFVMSLSEDSISSVPAALKYASLGMGATHSETIKKVIIPAAMPGIISAVMLGISRGIGETMIVVMAAGLSSNLTVNPLEAVTTVTVQIVTLLIGDHEFDSTKTLAAFALGLTLLVFTLVLNVMAQWVNKRFGMKYE
jgi:phosphate transport system permease protein